MHRRSNAAVIGNWTTYPSSASQTRSASEAEVNGFSRDTTLISGESASSHVASSVPRPGRVFVGDQQVDDAGVPLGDPRRSPLESRRFEAELR